MSGALIVCIENDPAILDGMKTLLKAWDAEVIAVADPEAAIAAIESSGGRVTGLLVDYHLDRGNGVAAIREIRRRFGESMPAILNEGAYDAWLTARPEKAKEFMRQYAAQWLTANPVEKKADKVPKGLLG